MAKIRGSFPGGPQKKEALPERTTPPRLSRVAEIEERSAVRSARRARSRRGGRLAYGFVVSVVVAGGLGVYLGLQSHTTIEDVRAEQLAESAPSLGIDMADMTSEINRTLLELWKMEDVEYLRNAR